MIIPWNTKKDPRGQLVSIITPTHNRPDLLREAVASVVAQTYRPIEHIIIGDGCPSLESAAPMLREINPDLRIMNLPRDPSVQDYGPARIARLRNTGVRQARGAFVGHLDDDNRFHPRHIESLIEAFRNQPEAAAAVSYRTLLIDGRISYTEPFHPWSRSVEEGKAVWEVFHRMGLYSPGSAVMRDRVSFHEERDCTVDTGELLVRREIHLLYPFLECYPEALIAEEYGEDDIFCEQLYRAGYRFVSSGESTLEFRLGGRFTSRVLNGLGLGATD